MKVSKKILAFELALVLAFSVTPMIAMGEVQGGYAPLGEVIFVGTEAELRDALLMGGVIQLLNDIDVEGEVLITRNSFTLDGNGFTISYTAHGSIAGLFRTAPAINAIRPTPAGSIVTGDMTIRNLGIYANINMTHNGAVSSSAGGVAGRVTGGRITIENSFVRSSEIEVIGRGSFGERVHVGGFFGEVTGGTVTIVNSFVNAERVAANASSTGRWSSFAYSGGFIGMVLGGANVSITNSYASGAAPTVSATVGHFLSESEAFAGGLVGHGPAVVSSAIRAHASVYAVTPADGIQYINPLGLELTVDELRNNRHPDWDWDTVWTFKPGVNDDLPVLRAFHPEELPQSTISFNPNGGTFINAAYGAARAVEPGSNIGVLPRAVPAMFFRENYRFAGWYTSPHGEGTRHQDNEYVTGSKTLYARWVAAPADFLLGDTHRDGYVTSADATAIARWLQVNGTTPITTHTQPGDFCLLSADINGDGTVTIDDIYLLQRWLVGQNVSHLTAQ